MAQTMGLQYQMASQFPATWTIVHFPVWPPRLDPILSPNWFGGLRHQCLGPTHFQDDCDVPVWLLNRSRIHFVAAGPHNPWVPKRKRKSNCHCDSLCFILIPFVSIPFTLFWFPLRRFDSPSLPWAKSLASPLEDPRRLEQSNLDSSAWVVYLDYK